MKSYFKGRPPQGHKPSVPGMRGFLDFSTSHDEEEYSRQRSELDGGRLEVSYDESKPQTVKGVENGKSE
jgi:hypothetical protein